MCASTLIFIYIYNISTYKNIFGVDLVKDGAAHATLLAAHLVGSLEFTALEATQGQMDGFFSQLPYKCNLEKVASMGD